jgi:hypothetical protein
MPGKASYAQKLTDHIGQPIDAACAINKTGATATLAVAGIAGAAARAAVSKRGNGDEIGVLRNGWLALGSRSFWLVKGDNFLGNPKGEPYATVDFDDVASVKVKPGRLSWRADVALADGRSFAFETKCKGVNRANPEVLELLVQRCN